MGWQLWNFQCSDIPPGMSLLRLNLDETSVAYWHPMKNGTIVVENQHVAPTATASTKATHAQQRTALTHIAIICDRPDVQPFLPQVLVANCRSVKAEDFANIRAMLPSNVIVIRAKTAWNNTGIMTWVVKQTAHILRTEFPLLFGVLLLDACKLHLHADVLLAISRAPMRAAIVPPRLTWLLAPLDTHTFASYKRFLRGAVWDSRSGRATGEMTLLDWLACIILTIRKVLQGKNWGRAFDGNGFGSAQALTRQTILNECGFDAAPCVGNLCPAVLALEENLIPRRFKCRSDLILKRDDPLATARPRPPAKFPSLARLPPPPVPLLKMPSVYNSASESGGYLFRPRTAQLRLQRSRSQVCFFDPEPNLPLPHSASSSSSIQPWPRKAPPLSSMSPPPPLLPHPVLAPQARALRRAPQVLTVKDAFPLAISSQPLPLNLLPAEGVVTRSKASLLRAKTSPL